ncbi:MAG: N-6 DNA methylase, partial [Alteraurantiacibacter sp. bin_em_oilr2.035]|nr:N-6 DNA methylase [Alteraurantiacibacter sp. bin_em_oilr2.035]
ELLPAELPAVEEWIGSLKTKDVESVGASDRARWLCAAVILAGWIGHEIDNAASALRAFGIDFSSSDEGALVASAALVHSLDRNRAAQFFPYMLDIYGRTSRLDVIRQSGRGVARRGRKAAGSFYTPQDVAQFMVASIADKSPSADQVWFDPAVGSGVFLREVLKSQGGEKSQSFACENLFGADVSPIACDFSAVLLATEACDDVGALPSAFRRIRSHMMAVDATKLHKGEHCDRLTALFPSGSSVRMICNPPYVRGAAVPGADGHGLSHLYLHFVQLSMTIAGRAEDAAVFVLPLAMGTNRSSDHRRVRSAIERAPGNWNFLFFDRQPHALFGEDAKTRATILVKRPADASTIRTSSLLKWTSKQRASIFDLSRSVGYDGTIASFVPKLGSDGERELYAALDEYRSPFGEKIDVRKAAASEIAGKALSDDVFVAGTAYNFLNVFRNYPDKLTELGDLSASGIHKIANDDGREAWIRTALLTSLTTFWLWHVECDGFHVPTYFLRELPLFSFAWDESEAARLELRGKRIWDGLSQDVIVSVNAGKRTFAFRPSQIDRSRGEVDEIILEKLRVSPRVAEALKDFERRTVSVDGSDRGRRTHSGRKMIG